MNRTWIFRAAVSCLLAVGLLGPASALAAETVVSGDAQITIAAPDPADYAAPEAQGPVSQYDYAITDTRGKVREEGTVPAGQPGWGIVLENGESVCFSPAGDSRGFWLTEGTAYRISFRVSEKAQMAFRASYTTPVPYTLLERSSKTTGFFQWGTADANGYVCLYAQNLSSDPVTVTEAALVPSPA